MAVQVFSSGAQLVLDARPSGSAVAVVLLLLRAPFLVVVFGAALTAAAAPAALTPSRPAVCRESGANCADSALLRG